MCISLLLAQLSQPQTRVHAEATITIDLEAPPAVVLPLFGPIREAEWAQLEPGHALPQRWPATGRQRLHHR
jgi:hypothetical protein